MDLYIFNTVINTLWYVFTVLFVLYRFTSFFTYIYGFVRFCGKLWSSIKWCYSQVTIYFRRRQGYTRLGDEESGSFLLPERSVQYKTPWQKAKDYVYDLYNRTCFVFTGRYPARLGPISSNSVASGAQNVQERESYIAGPEVELGRSYYKSISKQDQELFDRHLNSHQFNQNILASYKSNEHKAGSSMFQSVMLQGVDSSFNNFPFDPLLRSSIFNPVEQNERTKVPFEGVNSAMLLDSGFIASKLNKHRGVDQSESMGFPFATHTGSSVCYTDDTKSTSDTVPPIQIPQTKPNKNTMSFNADKAKTSVETIYEEDIRNPHI